jgi:hypothetical protein
MAWKHADGLAPPSCLFLICDDCLNDDVVTDRSLPTG